MSELNAQAIGIHQQNYKWWHDESGNRLDRNRFELLSLVVSEVSECLEGERKDLNDDKLPNRKMAEVEMADAYIRLLDYAAGFHCELEEVAAFSGTPENKGEALFEITRRIVRIGHDSVNYGPGGNGEGGMVSIALAYIRAYCIKHGYDLDGAIREKMEFNRTRADHTHEARKLENGKKF